MVKGEEGSNSNNSNSNDDDAIPNVQSMETIGSPTHSMVSPSSTTSSSNNQKKEQLRSSMMEESPGAAVRFPCMEQPPRFALRSATTGIYLGGTKRGRLVGRKKRCDNDEWTIALVDGEQNNNNNNNNETVGNSGGGATSTVTFHNYKFDNVLSLVEDPRSALGRTVACVSPSKSGDDGTADHKTATSSNINNNSSNNDLGLSTEDGSEFETVAPPEPLPEDEEEDDDEGGGEQMVLSSDANKEDLQWCVIRCTEDDAPNGGVMIVSLKTGESLGVKDNKIVLLPNNNGESITNEIPHVWEMECVTGELVFLNNPAVGCRIRTDMAGLVTLSANWKGWEVFRITEVASPHYSRKNSGGGSNSNNNTGEGYVRISSWMHSQWFLCSDVNGVVSTCSLAESLEEEPDGIQINTNTNNGDLNIINNPVNLNNSYRCSKWAIEKYPSDEGSGHEGLIIRSVTHGRLLSIKDGILRTYDSGIHKNEATPSILPDIASAGAAVPSNHSAPAIMNAAASPTNGSVAAEASTIDGIGCGSVAIPNGDALKQSTDEFVRKAEEVKRKSAEWWKQGLTNLNKTIHDAAIERRNSKLVAAGEKPIQSLPEAQTIVWQLEAAHLQTYYFISSQQVAIGEEEQQQQATEPPFPTVPRSIGAFPSVTDNLRKSDKIQLIRNDESPDVIQLYLPEEQYFITCSSKGSIFATKQHDDEGTKWTLEETSEGGSIITSRAYGLYLSFRNEDSKTPPPNAFAGIASTLRGSPRTASATAESPSSKWSLANAFASTSGDASAPLDMDENSEIDTTTVNASNGGNKPKNPFENLKSGIPLLQGKPKPPLMELCATEEPCVWNMEPCTPRAISSKRLKTFAIGTSIAVGTTIAMPFALAGVAAAMGAMGAEIGVGFGIAAAAATGAEALASVGAIGATAYFCFKPEKNSLGDDLDTNGNKANQNPWSKRPFGNWRQW